jgi:tRNA (guanine-N7-)-methyltransferase
MNRHFDPFKQLPEKLRGGVNPYIDYLRDRESIVDGRKVKLPVLHSTMLQGMAGVWRQELKLSLHSKLFIEIGSHYGHTLAELSGDYPEFGFVGLDITYKRVVKTAERLIRNPKALAAANARSILSYASPFTWPKLFNEGEVDGVLVFFPDPWSKQSQHKNRLLSTEFLQQLAKSLKNEGFLWLRTDHEEYFNSILKTVDSSQLGFIESEHLPDCFESTSVAPKSSFASLFQSQSKPIFERVWTKSPI